MKTKVCNDCGKRKRLAAFIPNKNGRGGVGGQCRICRNIVVRAYRQSPQGKAKTAASLKRHRSKESTKAHRRKRDKARYRDDPKYRAKVLASCRAFAKTPIGKKTSSTAQRKYRARNQTKLNARAFVNFYVKSGRLARPDSLRCVHCNGPARHYHHHLGYAPKNWLDVEPLCTSCHGKAL